MFRSARLLMLLFLLLFSAPAANAQDVSILAERVRSVVKEKASCWKLYNQQEGDRTVWVNWVCGKEAVIVYLYQVPSTEAARELLYEIRTSPVASLTTVPGAPPLDSYQFGDESHVRSYFLYSNSSYVFFRKGNIVVRIDSSAMKKTSSKRTLRNAILFAQIFADQIPPLNNGMHPTAK